MARLSAAQRDVAASADAGSPLLVSDISLWEVATLHSLGRIRLTIPLREWLEKATAPPLVRRQGISPAIAEAVAALPDSFHRDPADRILVATARVLGATLLTRDRRITPREIDPTSSANRRLRRVPWDQEPRSNPVALFSTTSRAIRCRILKMPLAPSTSAMSTDLKTAILSLLATRWRESCMNNHAG